MPVDKKEPSPLVEAGIEQQTCLGLRRFHEAEKQKHMSSFTLPTPPLTRPFRA